MALYLPKILLVEDTPLLMNLARRMLLPLDASIEMANNGEEAWEVMDASPADVVVTDLIMPRMSGFELIVKLREDHRFQHTYILVMTSLDHVSDKVRALSSGANDYVVKPLDHEEFRARVANGLREMSLKRELNRTMAILDDELKAVAKIQKNLLPAALPNDDRVRCAVSYQPCSRSGGDYYNVCYDNAGRLILTLADVSGHGAGAAVLMAMFRVIFDLTMLAGGPAAGFMGALNQALLRQIGQEPSFITTGLGIVDMEQRRLEFCSAGHGDQFLIGPKRGDLRGLSSGGPVLGFFDTTWKSESLIIQPGQSLVFFSDGLIEAINYHDEEFGQVRLEEVLFSIDPESSPEFMVEVLLAAVRDFTGPIEFGDDVSILVARFL